MFSQFMYIIELSSCFPFNQNNIARISDHMKHPFLLKALCSDKKKTEYDNGRMDLAGFM